MAPFGTIIDCVASSDQLAASGLLEPVWRGLADEVVLISEWHVALHLLASPWIG